MSDNWSDDELEASVKAYIEMTKKSANGEKFSKTSVYRSLNERYGRSPKAYEYRMQNISYIYDQQGRPWLEGLKPLSNVGVHVFEQIKGLVEVYDPMEIGAQVTATSKSSEELLEIKDGATNSRRVPIGEKKGDPGRIVRSKKELIIRQTEDKLVNRYKNYLMDKSHLLLEKNIIELKSEGATLETDGWIQETETLIEAKSESSRENIRMAIGQLFDYARHLDTTPSVLAILLPDRPSDDLIELLSSLKINIIYEKGNEFFTEWAAKL